MEDLTISISKEDYETLKLLAGNQEFKGIQKMIKEAIKVYICSWVQFIPYIKRHPEWVCPEIFESLERDSQ